MSSCHKERMLTIKYKSHFSNPLVHVGYHSLEDFSCFPYISLCKTCDPPEQAHFLTKGHNLNKLGRGPLGDATYYISSSRPCGFRPENFLSFHFENLFLTCVT